MEFIIKINMDNAAFETPEYEITQRLNKIHDQVRDGVVFGKVLDTNGNTCGFWAFVERDELVDAAMEVVEVRDIYEMAEAGDQPVSDLEVLSMFSEGADKCKKAIAKEIARQIGDWRKF